MSKFEEWWKVVIVQDFDAELSDESYFKKDVVKLAFQAGERAGMERAAEIAEHSKCTDMPIPKIIANAIRKELKEG